MLVQAIKAVFLMGCCGVTLGMIHSFTRSESAAQSSIKKIYLDPRQIAVEKSGLFIDLDEKLKPIQALYYDGKRFYVEEEDCQNSVSRQEQDCPRCLG